MSTTPAGLTPYELIWDCYLDLFGKPSFQSARWHTAKTELLGRLGSPYVELNDDDLRSIAYLSQRLLGFPEMEALRVLWDQPVIVESHLVACGGMYALERLGLAKRTVPGWLRLFAETKEERQPYWRLTSEGLTLAELTYG